MIDLNAPVAVAGTILADGRWRLTFHGEVSTPAVPPWMAGVIPMRPAAHTVAAARGSRQDAYRAPGMMPASWATPVPSAMLFVRNPTEVSHGPASMPRRITAWRDR